VAFSKQRLPLSQGVPSATTGVEHMPVVGSHAPAPWQAAGMGQTTGLFPVHTPFWQVSLSVQRLPSLHACPLGTGGLEHMPVVGSHAPVSWHWSRGEQTTGAPPVQTPAWQLWPVMQRLPALQAVPLGFAMLVQAPVAGMQVLGWWQASAIGHRAGFVPVHTPDMQTSVWVQALPSLQNVPSGCAGFEQPFTGSHVPAAWH
jgi:hypothetical protein